MERYKKKEIMDAIGALEKANDSIGRSNNKASQADVIDALSQCQETAIFLGNYFETLGEEIISFVKILEDYCENLYQMSIVLSDGNQCRKLSKRIQKQLTQLHNGIKQELPDDKKEIIFLPYKASMWDSLESVWRAAAEDENCNAYVVPIPYFDRNLDGTLGQMHYEGNEYPEYVPVISWEEYSIAERKPDVIYIHNPYDDSNIITTVHPAFYASELKKYTNMLVYIPYFVCAGDRVQEHFCVTPGTLYADKVIVQSEAIRKIYVEELHKFERENNCKNTFGNIEKKVLALGSPKYDKVLNTRKCELDIPKEWLDVIRKQDGSMKKVVLYNTSIANILEHKEMILMKIEDVLSVFKESQEEVALLWRPHPLMQATLKSMRPQLWNQYSDIVMHYKSEGWGIFDDSSDMNRAITLSDAYYGDGGSMLALYQKTGKPILVQNVRIINKLRSW
jgi:hypothetical protein